MTLRTTQLSRSPRIRPLRKIVQSAGTSVTASTATVSRANDFVTASGRNIFPSIPPSAKTGRNDRSMITTEKKIGRPTAWQAGSTIARTSPRTGRVAEVLAEPVHRVLDHHDRRVHQHADRDRDPRQRHDVRLDVGDPERPAAAPSARTTRGRRAGASARSRTRRARAGGPAGRRARPSPSPRRSSRSPSGPRPGSAGSGRRRGRS